MRLRPGHDRDAPAGDEHAPDLAQRPDRVGKQDDPEHRQRGLERSVAEWRSDPSIAWAVTAAASALARSSIRRTMPADASTAVTETPSPGSQKRGPTGSGPDIEQHGFPA